LEKTVATTLRKADEMELKSIAMPAISCGIFHFPIDQATEIIIKAIDIFFRKNPKATLETIILIDTSEKPLTGFLEATKKVFGKSVEMKGKPRNASQGGRHESTSSKSEDRSGRGLAEVFTWSFLSFSAFQFHKVLKLSFLQLILNASGSKSCIYFSNDN
jgi:hypothetical protein